MDLLANLKSRKSGAVTVHVESWIGWDVNHVGKPTNVCATVGGWGLASGFIYR